MLAFDYVREAYVLRGIGDRIGPVLREDRRRGRSSSNGYKGPERRGVARGRQPHVTAAPAARSTPAGQGRSKTAAPDTHRGGRPDGGQGEPRSALQERARLRLWAHPTHPL